MRLVALVALLTAMPASATTTYLGCAARMPNGQSMGDMKFALDEAAGTVVITFPTGKMQSGSAEFAAGSVSFNDGMMNWKIDRSSLSATAQPYYRGSAMGPSLAGSCAIEAVPKRAF